MLIHKNQTGITLIEVIVALGILSIGLLSLGKLEVIALQTNYLAYQKSVAASQLISMANRLFANFTKRDKEYAIWNAINTELLPRGKGQYHCKGLQCQIDIHWQYHGKQQLTTAVSLSDGRS